MTHTTFVRTVSLFSLLFFAPNCGKDDDAGFGGGGEPAEMDPNQGSLDGGGSDGDATSEDSGSTSTDTGSDDGVGDGGEDGSADAGDDGGWETVAVVQPKKKKKPQPVLGFCQGDS